MIHEVSRDQRLVMLVMLAFEIAASLDADSFCAAGEHDRTGHAPARS
jgi:hypothetical protein